MQGELSKTNFGPGSCTKSDTASTPAATIKNKVATIIVARTATLASRRPPAARQFTV